jgi:hypothetical protein
MPVRARNTLSLILAATVALVVSCKSDKAAPTDAGPAGEACISPGQTETGCGCTGGGIGHRSCGADKIWEACSCPSSLPDGSVCSVGQLIPCHICAGEAKPRTAVCLQDGTFDCSCPAQDAGKPILDAGQSTAPDAGSPTVADAGSTADAS